MNKFSFVQVLTYCHKVTKVNTKHLYALSQQQKETVIKKQLKYILMKHLIETADSSSLAIVPYDRIVLDTTTNEIVCKGGMNTLTSVFQAA